MALLISDCILDLFRPIVTVVFIVRSLFALVAY